MIVGLASLLATSGGGCGGTPTSGNDAVGGHGATGGGQATGGATGAGGASVGTDASVFCTQSAQAACAEADGGLGCPETWPEAESDRSVCDRAAAFDEEKFDCTQYFVLRTTRTDWGYDFLYDKGTGKLVAVLGWGPNPGIVEGCAGGPADLAPTGLAYLTNCTSLGDCWSQPDGGSASDGP